VTAEEKCQGKIFWQREIDPLKRVFVGLKTKKEKRRLCTGAERKGGDSVEEEENCQDEIMDKGRAV
jgi:hypothetical protein